MLKVIKFLCYTCIIGLASAALIEVKQRQNATLSPLQKTERETPENNCVTDPCLTLSKYCENDGECVTDPFTCNWKCACSKGYYGSRCQYELEKRNTSEEKEHSDLNIATPKTAPNICSGQVCVHGECVSAPFGTSSCQCNEGWFGANCGTFGAIIDDDFLKSLTESLHEKLSKIEKKTRSHAEEGNRYPKNISDSVRNRTEVFGKLINNSKAVMAIKDGGTSLSKPRPKETLKNRQIEVNKSLETEENSTLIEDSLYAKYNVCNEDLVERSEEERTCENAKDVKCVYGVCNETLTDYGTWKGYTTKCICDFGATGLFCENKCCLDCGENGKCDVRDDEDNVTEHCNCRHRYTGFFCEIYQPDPVSIQLKEDTWYMWVVGVCVGTFVILVTLAVVGPYFMWKHRVILVMKIVHYFQAYEDDDEKEWDAFVSYKSHPTDEQFVVRTLYPKLEKELGFKLCLHFRDFVPGETISNNIINAVEGSRRTILVLTPRYVESEFTRFEYQKAQTEMLKRKHRIIPIMLEDISEVSDIDKNLKGIIGSVTYLEWPGTEDSSNSSKKLDKFWKRLQLSLPKKKVTDCEKSPIISSVSPVVSSLTPSGKIYSDSSDRDSGFKSSVTSDISRGSTASESIENWWVSDSTYAQISDVFCDDISESVQPLTEEEEFELIAKGTKRNENGDILPYDYVDMEHDRYVEFKPEDNPPSARLVRKMQQDKTKEIEKEEVRIVKKELGENYIEFELEKNTLPASIDKKEVLPENYIEIESEENSEATNITKKDLPENYIEFKVEDAFPTAHVVRKELPENYVEFKLENNSPPSSIGEDELPENYIEFKAEDNPPSPSLFRRTYPIVKLDIDDYIEVDV